MEAAFVGESMAQAMVYDERHPGVLMYDGWRMVLGGERGDGIHETQRMEHWDTFDPRARYTYEAICTSEVMCNPVPGRGMAYMGVFQDRDRAWRRRSAFYEDRRRTRHTVTAPMIPSVDITPAKTTCAQLQR